jgi:hypothetical protein
MYADMKKIDSRDADPEEPKLDNRVRPFNVFQYAISAMS